MPALPYLLILFALLLIGVTGIFIASKAKEELKQGKRHFLLAEKAILVIAAGLVASTLPRAYVVPAYLFLALSLLVINKEIYAYMILGGSIAATYETAVFTYLIALIAVYFLSSAALLYTYTFEQEDSLRNLFQRAGILYALFLFAGLLGHLL